MQRIKLQKQEAKALMPWGMKSVDTKGRQYPEDEAVYRTHYQRDRDRIIHSKAFRRLEYKTQVFLNHEGDHYRTRLTHTLEVAQISQTIARALGLNEDLTEAIALAHDLGHTPFGHCGEEALQEVMAEHGGFEHNKHGLRIVDVLEKQYPDFPGLNLTYEVREGIAKHTTRWDKPEIKGFGSGPPLLEAQVVELADSIAYDNHDLDDGLAAGILKVRALEELSLWRKAEKQTEVQYGELDSGMKLRQCVRNLISLSVNDVIKTSLENIEKSGVESAGEVREHSAKLVEFSDELLAEKTELEGQLHDELYRNHRVMIVTNSARRFLKAIFKELADDPRELPPEYQAWAGQVGTHQAVCDYVAGMTDRYAQDLYLQMFQPYQKL